MSTALFTDLYELTMAAGYLRRRLCEPATFSLFVRRLPAQRGFLVAAGLESCLEYLESFRFDDEDLSHLERLGFDADSRRAFGSLRFTGDLWAVCEGRVVTAQEPLLEVTAPLPEAQLVETYLLNQITFQTALASKAARCRLAAADRIDLVEFGFRRAHGIDAGMAGARCSAIAGFVGTSNVEAARRLGLVASGTMAHSWVEAFPSELDAFRAFAADWPDRTTLLVDTYDTLEGVQHAATVIGETGLGDKAAVRLDSGDLSSLAFDARKILDAAGLPSVRIFVSGGLDEHDLARFVELRAPIDAAGVGTKLSVSADAPALDSAYKLVAVGERPVAKLSPDKATLPGAKQVFRARRPERDGLGDTIALRRERLPAGSSALLEPVMRRGKRLGSTPSLAMAREAFESDLRRLPEPARALADPVPLGYALSPELAELAGRIGVTLGDPGDRTLADGGGHAEG